MNETETARDTSFCSHGILNGDLFMMPDATNENQELERITETQRRIISLIAHDVRSPLASIVSLFQLYQNKMIDPDRFNNLVIIHVTDTGIGMPDTMCERLFLSKEKYSRRGTQNEHGSGLGLVLIKEFVEKARGTIAVKSTEGKGSSFIIDIPLQPV